MDSPNSTPPAGSDDGRQRAQSLVGQTLSQRYRIDALLAFGGMGAVYRGEHVLMRKRIAVKVLLPNAKDLPQLVERFQREAIVGAHVSHPNIASATDFGQLDDGSYFLVLEHIKGKTLYDVIRDEGALDLDRAVGIARQMAVGLHAAHDAGVVHRDIKPHNVMLVDLTEGNRTASIPALLIGRDVIKIIDFGFASVAEERLSIAPATSARPSMVPERITQQGEIFGTIAYLAPEASLGMDAVDARSDLYALGVVMYLMLTGKHPFDATEPAAIFRSHLTMKPPTFAVRNPAVVVPPAVEAIVMRLLAKNPAERFPNALAVVGAIDEAMGLSALVGGVRISSPGLPGDLLAQVMANESSGHLPLPAPTAPGTEPSPTVTAASAIPESKATIAGAPEARPVVDPLAGVSLHAPRRRWMLGAGVVGVMMLLTLIALATDNLRRRDREQEWRERRAQMVADRAKASAAAMASAAPGVSAAPAATGPAVATSGSAGSGVDAPVASVTPSASAAPPASAAVVEDPAAAAAWKLRFKAAAQARDWPRAQTAFHELAQRAPASLGEPTVMPLVSDWVVAAAYPPGPEGDRLFKLLESDAGPAGLDVLFDLVQRKGGSLAAERAAAILKDPAVRARGSKAMQIAYELRSSACTNDELFARAVSEGDGRALQALRMVRGRCGASKALDQADRELFAKLSR